MHHRRIISAVLFCLYIAAVAYLCFARPEELPKLPDSWFGLASDKIGHFLMFLPFPLLGFITFDSSLMSGWRRAALVFAICVIGAGAAVGTEQIQAQLEYRSAERADLIADAAGLAAGVLLTAVYIMTRKSK